MSFFDKSQPLGLPKGSVRALLAMGILCSVSVGVYLGVITPEQAGMAAGPVVVYYFENRRSAE